MSANMFLRIWSGTYRCRRCGLKNLVTVTSGRRDSDFRIGSHTCLGVIGKHKAPCLNRVWLGAHQLKLVGAKS